MYDGATLLELCIKPAIPFRVEIQRITSAHHECMQLVRWRERACSFEDDTNVFVDSRHNNLAQKVIINNCVEAIRFVSNIYVRVHTVFVVCSAFCLY